MLIMTASASVFSMLILLGAGLPTSPKPDRRSPIVGAWRRRSLNEAGHKRWKGPTAPLSGLCIGERIRWRSRQLRAAGCLLRSEHGPKNPNPRYWGRVESLTTSKPSRESRIADSCLAAAFDSSSMASFSSRTCLFGRIHFQSNGRLQKKGFVHGDFNKR